MADTPEILAGLTIDGRGLKDATGELTKQDALFRSMAGSVGSISSGVSTLSHTLLGLVGLQGAGAIINAFSQIGDAGSAAALAAGRVRGGAGTYAPYSKAFLNVQAATGVNATQAAQGFITALQMVGGKPSPAQAAVIGGLLAGYGQSVGLSPTQVAAVLSPILLSTGQGLGSAASVAATLNAGLTAFPGSQAQPALQAVSQQVASLLAGTGGAVNPALTAQITALTNAIATINPALYGHGNVANQAQAQSAITGALQGAYTDPRTEALLKMGGISYGQQRVGATPATLQKLVDELIKLYPNPQARDQVERANFGGITGADYLNTLATPAGQAALAKAIAAGRGNNLAAAKSLHSLLSNLQAQSAPSAVAQKLQANGLKALLDLPGLLKLGAMLPSDLATEILGTEGGGPNYLKDIGGLLGLGTGPTTQAGPKSVMPTAAGSASAMVRSVFMAALQKYGAKGVDSKAAIQWMLKAAYNPQDPGASFRYGGGAGMYSGGSPSPQAEALMERVLQSMLTSSATAKDPTTAFEQAVSKFGKYIDKLTGGGKINTTAAYSPSASGFSSTPIGLIDATAATSPGMIYAALLGAGSSGASGAGGGVSLASSPALGSGSGSIPMTWNKPLLHYSNGAYGVAYLNSLLPGPASGAVKGDRQAVNAAAGSVPASLLWAIYGAESSWGHGGSNWFGLIAVPRTGSFAGDARASAAALARLYQQYATSTSTASTAKSGTGGGTGSSGGGSTGSGQPSSGVPQTPTGTVMTSMQRAAPPQTTHVHVHLDGRIIDQHRRLTRGSG
jgi:hypothetical protein